MQDSIEEVGESLREDETRIGSLASGRGALENLGVLPRHSSFIAGVSHPIKFYLKSLSF